MTAIDRIRQGTAMGLVVLASAACFPGVARSQSIAYTPNVSSILDGAALNVTPAVSADRRYVRLTLNPYFNTVNGFSTYSAQVGAVSGGGNLAGMGGVIGGGGAVGPTGAMTLSSSTGTYLAGDYSPPPAPSAAGFGEASVDPFDQAAAGTSRMAGANPPFAGRALAADSEPAHPFAMTDAPEGPSVRAGNTSASRRKAARKAARRPATTKTKRRP